MTMIHDEIKAHRKKLGISLENYASLFGVTLHTIWRWEHGKSKPSRMAEKIFKQLKERYIHPHEET